MESACPRVGKAVLNRHGAEEHATVRHDPVSVLKKPESIVQEELMGSKSFVFWFVNDSYYKDSFSNGQ